MDIEKTKLHEKLVELLDDVLDECDSMCNACGDCRYFPMQSCTSRKQADHLINNNVTVQEVAYWKDVMQINGECFGYCSNCLTEHKAQNYAVLVMSHRHCRWCGCRLTTTPFSKPPKGE